MDLNHQRGELSLVRVAVLMGLLALAAMTLLFSIRYERNYFAEAWRSMMKTSVAATLTKAQSIADGDPKTGSAEIRKCTIEGKVMYTNVECGDKNPSTRVLVLQDTRGIEPPKAPPAAAQASEPLDHLIEKLHSNPTVRRKVAADSE